MHYSSVLDAVVFVRQLGPGALMGKSDLYHAYRIILADNHPLLGIKWDADTIVYVALPFHLRAAPKIFLVFVDALVWSHK